MITSRGTGRWVIPKGWPMRGLKPQDAAAMEASEEAGLVGEIEDQPIGSYRYLKQLRLGREIDVQVIVFAFRVTYQADDWKEQQPAPSSNGAPTARPPTWSPSPP